ncbi:replication protein [Pandoraea sp. SD6-2]|uniref:replication protein n=1 Tax=Pandoraea sp. SD6-2 TaxID=1286093 RepID=UPI00032EB790|nr:replication protein [Pandoraea sp. SD6-2]EON11931.1 replication protein O [Pandoraea sp. SD6-2]
MAQAAQVIQFPEAKAPQLEDGYLRIANELRRAITWARLTAYQRCILDVVMAQTYGFNKLSDDIARTKFEDETGIDASDVRRTIKQLVEMNIITRTEGRYAYTYGVNKRHATWVLPEARKLVNKPGFEEGDHPPIGGDSPRNEGGNPPVTGGESPPSKDNPKRQDQKTTSKETLSRSLRERFEIFWAGYPKRKSKKAAEKAFAKLNPDEQLFTDLMAGLGRAKKSGQWANPQYIPHAATWLNAGGWMDEIQSAYTDAELAVIRGFNEVLGEHVGRVDEAVFVEERAGAIRALITLGAEKRQNPEMWRDYFPWVKANVDMPPKASFDWLISPKGFSNVIGGQHNKADKR